jgi:GPH family glycoside/pentoside/hexuronide:cation symporter
VFNSLGLHANAFFWRLNPGQTQWVTTSLFAGLLAGAPFAGPLLTRSEKRTILVVGLAALVIGQGLPVTLRLLGWLPLTGDGLATLLSIIMFVAGVLLAAASIAILSMMADAADEHEHLFGARREGLFAAGWAFASKAAMGAGALISGLVLQFIAFPTDLAAHGGMAAVLPVKTVVLLGLAYGPGSAILTLAATLIASFYRLDRRDHAVILAKLNERRAGRVQDQPRDYPKFDNPSRHQCPMDRRHVPDGAG